MCKFKVHQTILLRFFAASVPCHRRGVVDVLWVPATIVNNMFIYTSGILVDDFSKTASDVVRWRFRSDRAHVSLLLLMTEFGFSRAARQRHSCWLGRICSLFANGLLVLLFILYHSSLGQQLRPGTDLASSNDSSSKCSPYIPYDKRLESPNSLWPW